MSLFLPLLLTLAAPLGEGAQERVEPATSAVAAAEDPEQAFKESLIALQKARRAFQSVGAGGDAARLAWLPRIGQLAEQGSIGAAAWLLRNDPERPAELKLELYARLQGTDRAPEMLPSLRRDATLLGRRQALSLAAEIGAAATDDGQRAGALLTQAQIQEDGRFAEPSLQRVAEGLHRDVVRLYPGTPAAAEAEDSLWRLERLAVGRVAPAFRGRDVDGNEIRVSELNGRVVVIEFWSFDDPGVAARIARRCALSAALRDERFALVGVCLDTDELAFRRALEEFEVCWPTAFEGMGSVWRIRNGPRTFVLDQSQVIRHVDLEGVELEQAVGRLLEKRKEAPKPSPSRAGEQNR